jgi:hypothetical protein
VDFAGWGHPAFSDEEMFDPSRLNEPGRVDGAAGDAGEVGGEAADAFAGRGIHEVLDVATEIGLTEGQVILAPRRDDGWHGGEAGLGGIEELASEVGGRVALEDPGSVGKRKLFLFLPQGAEIEPVVPGGSRSAVDATFGATEVDGGVPDEEDVVEGGGVVVAVERGELRVETLGIEQDAEEVDRGAGGGVEVDPADLRERLAVGESDAVNGAAGKDADAVEDLVFGMEEGLGDRKERCIQAACVQFDGESGGREEDDPVAEAVGQRDGVEVMDRADAVGLRIQGVGVR